MMDKITNAVEAAGLLFKLGGHILDAIRRGEPERVDEILPPEDRARLHLLELEAKARAELGGE